MKRNKGRTIPIILLIFLATGFGISFLQMAVDLDSTNRAVNDTMKMGDIWLGTVPINNTVFNQTVVSEWNQSGLIEAVQQRIYVAGHIIMENGDRIPVDIIGLPEDIRASVNDIFTTDGTYFDDHGDVDNGAYVSDPFILELGWETSDSLSIQVGHGNELENFTLQILGGQYSAEYPFRKSDYSKLNLMPDLIIKLNIYVRADYLQQELLDGEELYNQIAVKLKDPDKVKEVLTDMAESDFSRYVFITEEFPGFLRDMPDVIVVVCFVFCGFLFFISMFSIYLTINRFIEEEKSQIGVMKSLGYKNRFILNRYLLYGVILALVGSIPGVLYGYVQGSIILQVTAGMMFSWPFTISKLTIEFAAILIGGALATSVLACYLSARTTVKITPQAAIRPQVEMTPGSKSIFEKIIETITRRRVIPAVKYYLRATFQKPKKTVFSIIAITSAVALLVMMTSFVAAVNGGSAAIMDAEMWDLTVELAGPLDFNQTKTEILESIDGNVEMEPLLIDYARIETETTKHLLFIGVRTNTTMKNFEGVTFQANNSAILSPGVARMLDLDEGSSYTIAGRNDTEYEVYIQAVLSNDAVSGFYIPIDFALKLSAGDDGIEYANAILVVSDDPEVLREIQKQTEEGQFNFIEDVITVESLIASIQTFLEMMMAVLAFLVIAAGLLASTIIFGIMSITTAERKNDLMIMKALGIRNRRIYRYAFTETTVIAVISGVLGYVGGFFMYTLLLEWMQAFLTMTVTASGPTTDGLVIAVVFAFATLYLGQFLALRLVLKQKIAEVTKEKLFA
jgi:ABC-type antimicrobial peptide transport system permease subunit